MRVYARSIYEGECLYGNIFVDVVAIVLHGKHVFVNNLVTRCETSGADDYHVCVDLRLAHKDSSKFCI